MCGNFAARSVLPITFVEIVLELQRDNLAPARPLEAVAMTPWSAIKVVLRKSI
jgi:hypothetical protein